MVIPLLANQDLTPVLLLKVYSWPPGKVAKLDGSLYSSTISLTQYSTQIMSMSPNSMLYLRFSLGIFKRD